jgi:hypothetical protein
MKLTKLDRRHNGVTNWKYYVELYYSMGDVTARNVKFNQMREWCWEIWGASKELTDYDHYDLYDGIHCSNAHWCWLNDDHGRRRIYFRTDHEAEVFTLRWL